MPYNSKAFGIVVGRLRVQHGMTQEQLSARAGIARSHLAMLESGKKTVRLDTFWRVAEALCVEPEDLMRQIREESR